MRSRAAAPAPPRATARRRRVVRRARSAQVPRRRRRGPLSSTPRPSVGDILCGNAEPPRCAGVNPAHTWPTSLVLASRLTEMGWSVLRLWEPTDRGDGRPCGRGAAGHPVRRRDQRLHGGGGNAARPGAGRGTTAFWWRPGPWPQAPSRPRCSSSAAQGTGPSTRPSPRRFPKRADASLPAENLPRGDRGVDVDVFFDGAAADPERLTDRLVALAFGHEREHLALAEHVERVVLVVGPVDELGDDRASLGDPACARGEIVQAGEPVFQQVANASSPAQNSVRGRFPERGPCPGGRVWVRRF